MSVALIGIDEFGNVATTILMNEYLKSYFLNGNEKFMKLLYKKQANPEPSEIDILAFVERLYIANRLAYYYQYGDECIDGKIEIKRLDETDLFNKPVSYQKLLQILRDIHYNLYTNAGRCFLGREDMERLERLIEACKDAVIEHSHVIPAEI